MPEYKYSILSTRLADDFLIKKAKTRNIRLDAVSFIETGAVDSIEIQQEIDIAATEYATVVFTSANAVEAVASMLHGETVEWRIFCIAHHTKDLVSEYFGEAAIEDTADNASELADKIIEHDDAEEVIYFCGNRRRDELPRQLKQHGIAVNEIVVYETIATPRKLEKKYDAVLFFSPSAAESFFSANSLPKESIVFVIGSTTQKAVRKCCSNEIIMATETGKEALIEQAIRHFS